MNDNRDAYIFLSYRSTEDEFALQVAADLKNRGVRLWMDRYELQPGQDWLNSLQKAIDNDLCVGMLAILSPEYLKSEVCMDELSRAKRLGKPIFPIMLHPLKDSKMDWPIQIERIQFVPFFNAVDDWHNTTFYDTQLQSLLKSIEERFKQQVGAIPDAETRYLNKLIAYLSRQRSGVAEYVEISGEGDQPQKNSGHTADDGWDSSYTIEYQSPFAPSFTPASRPAKIALSSIRTAVNDYPSFVLTGASGSGKTTTLRRIALDIALARLEDRRTKPLPLLLRLASWEGDITPSQFVRVQWQKEADLPNVDPINLIASGQVVLLLDGLNEMGDKGMSRAEMLREWLKPESKRSNEEMLALGPPPKRVIISCRTQHYTNDMDLNLPVVTLGELTDTQIRQFAAHYLEDQANLFISRVFSSDSSVDAPSSLLRLARNPYTLGALLYIFAISPQGNLPHNHGRLFHELVLRIWERERQRNSTNWVDLGIMLNAFGELAFSMIDEDKPLDVPYAWAVEQITQVLDTKSEETASSLLTAGQYANLIEIDDDKVRFYHQSLQSYFAALKLGTSLDSKLESPSIDGWWGRRGTKWDSAVIALAGLVPEGEVEDFIRYIGPSDPWLAAECVASGITISDEVRQILLDIFVDMSTDEEIAFRMAAAQGLGSLRDPVVIPKLLDMLCNPENSRYAGERIIEALMSFGDQVIPGLIDLIDGKADEGHDIFKPSFLADSALYRMKSQASIPGLIKLLLDGKLSQMTATTLGQLGEATLPGLYQALEHENPNVRGDALWALNGVLRDFKDTTVIPLLIKLLGDSNQYVRDGAGAALMQLGTAAVPSLLEFYAQSSSEEMLDSIAEVLFQIGEPAIPAIIERLNIADHQHRAYLSKALARFGDIVIPSVAEKLHTGTTNERIGASWTLGMIGSTEAFNELDKALHSEDDELCQIAIAGIISPSQEAIATELLASIVSHSNPNIRGQVINGLVKMKHESAIPALIRALEDKEPDLRLFAALELADRREEAAIPVLIEGLQNRDNHARLSAAQALGNYDQKVIAPLLQALRSSDMELAIIAARALAFLGEDAKEPLVLAAKDANDNVRFAARLALGQLEDNPIERAFESFEDTTMRLSLRMAAGGILGNIGSPEIIDRLVLAYKADSPFEIRYAVIDALSEIGSEKGLGILLLGCTDEDPDIRTKALEGLSSLKLNPDVIPQLLESLAQDSDSDRYLIVRLISQIGDSAIPQLVTGLSHRNEDVRYASGLSLGLIGENAIPSLLAALKQIDGRTRIAALMGLAQIQHNTATEALLQSLQDKDEDIREYSALGLGKNEEPRTISALVSALSDQSFDVHRAAATALSNIGRPAVPSLIQLLVAQDTRLRQAASWALSEIGEDARTELQDAAENANGMMRFSARLVLGQMDDEVITRLTESLNDSDMQVRILSLNALRQYSEIPDFTEKAVLAILPTILSDEWNFKMAAFETMSEIGRRGTPVLLGVLNDVKQPIGYRVAAAMSITITRDERALPILLRIARDKQEHFLLRQRVAMALQTIGGAEARATLEEVEKDIPLLGMMRSVFDQDHKPNQTDEDN